MSASLRIARDAETAWAVFTEWLQKLEYSMGTVNYRKLLERMEAYCTEEIKHTSNLLMKAD